ncbi:MAG TPA: Flp pilus assembly protein CpaB, partial [Candidatus Dormibacteraeota bacterium]|nr:Flp pilus assembly protein CpaB [Candidatus Dormibacteraeota bacterium]
QGQPISPSNGNQQVDQVIAATDIPLGTTISQEMVKTQKVAAPLPGGTYSSASDVIGKVARKALLNGQTVTSDTFVTSAVNVTVPPGYRGISVQVDQVTGVGTLIQAGDFVDMVVGFTADKFPVVTVNRTGTAGGTGGTGGTGQTTITPITGINATSVKLLLQGMQVLGTLLPTPTTTQQQGGASAAPNQPTLNGQQEIVVVSVPAQYAEVIKFAQMDGNITLILRSAKDCIIPGSSPSPSPSPEPSGSPSASPGSVCTTTTTTGVILKTLVDKYGVLVPQVVQAILPSPTP